MIVAIILIATKIVYATWLVFTLEQELSVMDNNMICLERLSFTCQGYFPRATATLVDFLQQS